MTLYKPGILKFFGEKTKKMPRKIIRLLVIAVGAFIIFKFVFVPVRINGLSMEPTYRNGGLTFINRLAYLARGPARGEVVAIRTSGLGVMYMKRVIGLPDEIIEIDNGVVKINGIPIDEPYVHDRSAVWQVMPVKLSASEYYVIGDNRNVEESRHLFGRVEAGRIVGRALW